MELVQKISDACNLPIKMTTVKASLFEELNGKIENLFPLKLQDKII